MSKAKKFIEDYTRGCSNELCAVEDRYGKKVISYHEWLTPEQARSAVEIEREELIEKAVEWLYNNYSLGSEGMKNFREAMNYGYDTEGTNGQKVQDTNTPNQNP